MNKIYFRILIFLALIFVINFFIKENLQSALSINTMPELKVKFEAINKENFNTILLGSSRTYTSINPIDFDSLIVDNQYINCYNFGISAMFFPNSFYIASEILKVKGIKKPKILLVELSYDERFLVSDLNSLINEPYYDFFKNFSIIELYQFLRIRLKTSHEWLHGSFPELKHMTEDGFITMDERSKYFPEHILQHEFYLKYKTQNSKNYDPRIFVNYKSNSLEYRTLMIYLNKLIEICKVNNVKIFFYLPNRISTENRRILIPAYNELPDSLKFNPNTNPYFGQLMQPEFTWDLSHLNEKGANIYSKIFAEEFQKQITDKGYLK